MRGRRSFRLPEAVTFLALSAFPALARAQAAPPPQPPPPPPHHEVTADVAFVGTTGNSSTSSFAAGADYIARPTNWLIRNRARIVRNSTAGDVTAESLFYNFRAERTLTDRISAFGSLGLFRDVPAAIAVQTTLTGGVSFKVHTDERQSFVTDVGIGYLNEDRLVGDDISTATYGAGTSYKLKLSETADLSDDFRIIGTFARSDDWRFDHVLAVTAKLTTIFSLKASTGVRFANFPPPGKKKTDTTTAMALVASFKRQ